MKATHVLWAMEPKNLAPTTKHDFARTSYQYKINNFSSSQTLPCSCLVSDLFTSLYEIEFVNNVNDIKQQFFLLSKIPDNSYPFSFYHTCYHSNSESYLGQPWRTEENNLEKVFLISVKQMLGSLDGFAFVTKWHHHLNVFEFIGEFYSAFSSSQGITKRNSDSE